MLLSLFDVPIDTIYLYALIISGILIVLYLFFGDVLEGIGEIFFLNPVLILAFIVFLSTTGYVLEFVTNLHSLLIMAIAAITAVILDTLLNVFVLVPLASAEESLGYTEDSLKGKVGKVIIPIPKDGFGELIIENKFGTITKPAAHIENQEIAEGEEVLVLDIKNGVLYVEPYEYNLLNERF